MNLFVHSRADNAAHKPLRGWSRFLAAGALCLGLAACGGGGGGGDSPSTQPASGLLVTVVDTYGATIAGATVEASVGSSPLTVAEGANGTYLLTGAVGDASVTVSRDPFFVPKTVAATIAAGAVTPLTVELVRRTSAAGGSLSTRTTPYAPTIIGTQAMTFEIELVIVDSNSDPILNLGASNFVLLPCTPVVSTPPDVEKADCVRGTDASFDAAYTVGNGTPVSVEWVPGKLAVQYAAGLMLDQSASIAGTDPTGARLYSAKAFLDGLGLEAWEDWVLLSAFADGTGAKIANDPNADVVGGKLSVYREFRNSVTVSGAPSYYSSLDSLAGLVGGGTPLYGALDLLRGEVVGDVSVAGIAKSVVIFTDGDDTGPECKQGPVQCRTRRQQSIDAAIVDNVRIFTIGLSSGVDFEALGELANKTGGAFLFAENTQQLIPLYGSVGRLLSLSLPTYRISWTVNTDTANAFVPGNALLGKVQVNTGAETFDVPFIFGITGTP